VEGRQRIRASQMSALGERKRRSHHVGSAVGARQKTNAISTPYSTADVGRVYSPQARSIQDC